MPTFKKLLFGLIGFIVGAAIVIAFEGALLAAIAWLFQVRLLPRGLGWVVMPIVGGFFGARVGYAAADPSFFPTIRRNLARELSRFSEAATIETRLWFAFSLLWVVVVIMFFLVFDPFGRYRWSDREWGKFLTVLVGPAFVGFIAVRLYHWAIRKPQDSTGHEKQQRTTSDAASQATSATKGLVERFAATGDLSREEAAHIAAYYDRLMIKHNGDAKAARVELIEWLEGVVAAGKRAAEHARTPTRTPSYDPSREIGFLNLPPNTRLAAIGKRRVAYLPDGALVAETLAGGERWFASIDDFRNYTGVSGAVKPIEREDQ